MNQSPRLLTHLQRAEDHVQSAHQSWDATDISRCAKCVQYLQQAAGEILAAQQCAGESQPVESAMGGKAKDRLERLHGSVNRLGRLVDAAVAFHRGLAIDTGMDEISSVNGNG